MPRRSVLNAAERASLLAIPSGEQELIRLYTFNDADLRLIRRHRKSHNRLGFAVQLCYLRYPGQILLNEPDEHLLGFVSQQLNIHPFHWLKYSIHEETRRDHIQEILGYLDLSAFRLKHFRQSLHYLSNTVLQTDKGVFLAQSLVDFLRQQQIIVPSLEVIERLCAQAITQGNKRLYGLLTCGLGIDQQKRLDQLLIVRTDSKSTELVWLRQPPGAPSAKNLLTHIERLKMIDAIGIPNDLAQSLHANRLLKLAREGAAMTAQNLAKLEPNRRYATLAAIIAETRATVLDELVDLHERMLGKWFNRAKRKHSEQFQDSGKAINNQLRLFRKIGTALVSAKEKGGDAFQAIESVVPWDVFVDSISETERLSQPASFDHLRHVEDGYGQIRRYAPALLETLNFKAAPAAQDILDGIEMLKTLNQSQKRKVPEDAPTGFIKKRWQPLVIAEDGIERRYYEICALTELKNALRAGDISVQGSRQFKDFEDYLLPKPLAPEDNGKEYLEACLQRLKEELETVNKLAKQGELRDAEITASGLKITPLVNTVPDEAESFARKVVALLPQVKITDLLLEVDAWTGFTRHFRHLKNNEEAGDKKLLLTAILADGINLGLVKMAEACPGTTSAKLSWLQA